MQKNISYNLTFLNDAYIDTILKISNKQLGNGFLSRELLLTYIDNPDKFCQIALEEETVVGFSLMEIASCAEIASKFKSESEWFLNYFAPYKRIAYRSLTAVSPAFEGNGIASLLVKKGVEFLSKKAEVLVCDAWKSGTTFIGNILERNGYKAIREVPLYWTADSVNYQFQCKVCGNPPCTCVAVIYAKFFGSHHHYWWQRPDLSYKKGILTLSEINLLDFIKTKQTPIYIYDIDRIVSKYEQLCHVLEKQAVPFTIYYAMKANRHSGILSQLRIRTPIGIDVCSLNELDLAMQYGFSLNQLSYTGTALSDQEMQKISTHHHLRINLDSLSALRRFAKFSSQREIGIRINTGIGMAYNQNLEYTGTKITKFGIYQSEWTELKQLVEAKNLLVDTVHCHAGSGFLTAQLAKLPEILKVIDAFIELFPSVKTLNMGGGLGVPQAEGDEALDLKKWASIVCSYAKSKGLKLAFEPGDYLVKDAGILLAQVNTVEIKKGKLFVGIDAGMNVNNEYAYYNMNLEIVPLKELNHPKKLNTTVFGNINEPVDLFAEDKMLPVLEEGDYIALLNCGGYGASSSSNHCIRGDFKEYIICK